MGEGYPGGKKSPEMSRKNRIQRPFNEFLIDCHLATASSDWVIKYMSGHGLVSPNKVPEKGSERQG